MRNTSLLLLVYLMTVVCSFQQFVGTADLVTPILSPRFPNNSVVSVALIMIQNTAGNVLGQQIRVRVAQQLLADRNITLQSYLLLTTQVSVDVLFSLSVVHVTVNVPTAQFNATWPRIASNITFSFITQPPDSNVNLPNVEYSIVPAADMGTEIGILAGLISVTKSIAAWYGPFEAQILPGLRAGVNLTCPECTVSGYFLCSGSVVCAGELKQSYASAADADIVVTAYSQANVLPLTVFQQNQVMLTNASTTPNGVYKKVIIFGNLVGDLTSAVATHNDTLGCLALDQRLAVPRAIAEVILGTFEPSVRRSPSRWISPYFDSILSNSTNSSRSHGVTISYSQIKQFIEYRRLLLGGSLEPQYDAVGQLDVYAYLTGGRPFLPIGRIANGIANTSASTLSLFFDLDNNAAAVCVLSARTLVISSDLTMLYIFNAENAQFLAVALDAITAADYAAGNAAPATASMFNTSRRILFPTSSTKRRRHIGCSFIGDSLIISTRVTAAASFSSSSSNDSSTIETLRLLPICVAPTSTSCDFFLIENISNLVVTSFATAAASNPAAPAPSSLVFSGISVGVPSMGSVVFFTNCSTSLPDGSNLGCFVNTSTLNVLKTVVVSPPSSQNSFETSHHIFSSPLRGGAAVFALDVARRVVCRLNLTDIVLASVGSISSLSWRDETSDIPVATGSNVLCIFYIDSSQRLGTVINDGLLFSQPQVYHYSYLLGEWIPQGDLAYANAQSGGAYRCMALTGGAGGSALIIPQDNVELSRVTTLLYPTTIPDCRSSEGSVLSPSQQTCVSCSSGESATADGFCRANAALADDKKWESWMLAVVVIVGVAIAVGALVAVVPCILRSLSPWHRARLIKNAPLNNTPGCVLSIAVAGSEFLWNEVSATDDDDDGHSEHSYQRKMVGGPAFMRQAMDSLSSALVRRVASHDCYISSMRGDEAVVVSSSPVKLLCVAVEVAYELSERTPPLQLICGLHFSGLSVVVTGSRNNNNNSGVLSNPLERTTLSFSYASSLMLKRRGNDITFVGEAVTVAHAIRSKSRRGRIVATQSFLDNVDEGVLKVLALKYGSASTHQIGGALYATRELIVPFVSTTFDKTGNAFEQARLRRSAKLRENNRCVRQQPQRDQENGPSFLLHSQTERESVADVLPSLPRESELSAPALIHGGSPLNHNAPTVSFLNVVQPPTANSKLLLTSTSAPRGFLETSLFGLAAVVSRTILNNLGSTSVDGGSAAFSAIVSRLHLPLSKRALKDDVDARFVAHDVVKTLAMRMVLNIPPTELAKSLAVSDRREKT
ncbi:membrane-associated protein, putative [Bodo saltans]|uniref:Membrane-associated protein, putative n=1 Tax=Bodo saltans TaxID=75058 RepID=A0A0S4JJV5_BODSA|nr:membrane-associated protein, putative [Bodo saltans]|eukprot:CUG91803.1 membrane-associated protein, putative [Bodo saltans]